VSKKKTVRGLGEKERGRRGDGSGLRCAGEVGKGQGRKEGREWSGEFIDGVGLNQNREVISYYKLSPTQLTWAIGQGINVLIVQALSLILARP